MFGVSLENFALVSSQKKTSKDFQGLCVNPLRTQSWQDKKWVMTLCKAAFKMCVSLTVSFVEGLLWIPTVEWQLLNLLQKPLFVSPLTWLISSW